METMQMSLATTNPIRLGCALNFSVFLYEICQEPSLAILVAKNAFDDAVNDLEKVHYSFCSFRTLSIYLDVRWI